MALRDQPYLPLYVQDFLTDEKLLECSAESTGVYIRLMCFMHKSERYGTVTLRPKDKTESDTLGSFAQKLGRMMPYETEVIERSLRELTDEGVLAVDGDTLYQKRMVRDAELSDIRANSGKKGAEKTNSKRYGPESPQTSPEPSDAPDKAPSSEEAAASGEAPPAAPEQPKKTRSRKTEPKKDEPEKKAYADFVMLTEAEYARLVEKYGEEKTRRMIEVLNNYKGQSEKNKKKYDSDYRAILNWVVGRVEEEYAKRGGRSDGSGPTADWGSFRPSTGFRQG